MIRYCTNCLFPETKPDLSFNDNGVCDACQSSEEKNIIDWAGRRQEFEKLLDQYRNKNGTNYDCIVPVSGGKDSMYQVYMMKQVFGMNPLAVSWMPCCMSEIGWRNLRALKELGVDHIHLSGNPKVNRALVKEGFKRVGDNCWPEHVGIFTSPVRVAVNYKIPLIIWGENSQVEYGGPKAAKARDFLDRRWLEEFGGMLGNRVKDMVGVEGIKEQDLLMYTYPTDEELKAVGIKGLFLGHYLRWDMRKQLDIVLKMGFELLNENQEGTFTNFENLDCNWMALHDYLKFLKFGYGRATDHAGIDIRLKLLTREEGLRLVKKFDGKLPRRHLKSFLTAMKMEEDEFHKILLSFTNKALFKTHSDGSLMRDYNGDLVKVNYDNMPDAWPKSRVAEAQAR